MGYSEDLKVISFKLPEDKKLALEALLRKRGTNTSVFLRQAVIEFLEREDEGKEQLKLPLGEKIRK